jgi:hypothetical protein
MTLHVASLNHQPHQLIEVSKYFLFGVYLKVSGWVLDGNSAIWQPCSIMVAS